MIPNLVYVNAELAEVLLFPQVLIGAATCQQLNQNLRPLYILFKFIKFKSLHIDDRLNIIGHNS
jgi:hypothetical protein